MLEKIENHWIWKILGVILLCLLAWGFISWIEVCIKNVQPNPQYWEYNLILLFLR